MKDEFWRFGLFVVTVGLLGAGSSASGATVSLKAVKKNGGDIAPTSSIAAVAGDTIEAELILTGWGDPDPNFKVRTYQASIDATGYSSGTCGTVLPFGWDAPLGKNIACGTDDDCPSAFPDCNLGICLGAGHEPEQGAFIKDKICDGASGNAGDLCTVNGDCTGGGSCIDNDDFIQAGFQPRIPAVDTSALGYRFGGTLLPSDGPLDEGQDAYCGTVILTVREGSDGTFTIGFLEGPNTFLTSPTVPSTTMFPMSDPLVITVNGQCVEPSCEILQDVEGLVSSPPNCAIDARYPWEIDNRNAGLGWEAVDITFDGECDVNGVASEDFAVSISPPGGQVPAIADVSPVGGQTVRVSFNRIIRLGKWTCVEYTPGTPGSNQICLGRLPGDANNDRTAETEDILEIIDDLNELINPPLNIWQCDIDHSDSCQAPDILGEVNLLNGAGAFDVFLNNTISEACPSQ